MTKSILLSCGALGMLTAVLAAQQHQVKPDALPSRLRRRT
jgi:hypothetical protein